MPLTREHFARHLELSTAAVRKNIARFCWNDVPGENRYFVLLNSSFDGNPLAPGEHLFPDHDVQQLDSRVPRTADEVVERLWRASKIPEWINITPHEVDGKFLYSELRCCGRFTDDDTLLYHMGEGYPPFHRLGPALPVNYRELKHGEKFDLHCCRDRKSST